MSRKIAIGVGCRKGCPAAAIEAVVRQALERAPTAERLGLFTIRDKSGEAGTVDAAALLGLDLYFLTRDALREQGPFIATPSIAAANRFGIPSVAEAAALAGAGPGSILIVARIAGRGATCAIAESRKDPP
ncbi:MAG TPA: cobalamin biosynthesis protein [Stellaceae bacterium]|nr:cobalamin biosynthesis protein [Stellaceae bacterium]